MSYYRCNIFWVLCRHVKPLTMSDEETDTEDEDAAQLEEDVPTRISIASSMESGVEADVEDIIDGSYHTVEMLEDVQDQDNGDTESTPKQARCEYL